MPSATTKCPYCGTTISEERKFLPFCSDRCKLKDLGKWALGQYVVKGTETVQIDRKQANGGHEDDEF